MQLCLVLPGLVWPRKALYDSAYDLDLPSLAWLLGRGRIAWESPHPYEHWLCRAFGIEGTPAAPLRLLGAGTHPGNDEWICADAAHLALERTTMTLSAVGFGDLDEADAAELAETLAPLLQPFGELRLAAGGRGYLRLHGPAGIATVPPSAAVGRRADTVEPAGTEAMRWRYLANEVQMLLHGHPVNRRREAAGKTTVNTLWFWGADRLPLQRPCPYGAAWGGERCGTLLPGLAAWGEIPYAATPASAAEFLDHPHAGGLLALDALVPPTQTLDALAWREALVALERDWLAPLLAALRAGRIAQLTLAGLGDEAAFAATATPADRFHFWRKAVPLAELAPRASPA